MVTELATQPMPSAAAQPPRLLDQLFQRALQRGHSQETATVYVQWSRRYILFHGKRHSAQLGQHEIRQFLEHVAQVESQPLAAIALARTGLEFLYAELLHQDFGQMPWVRPPRLLDQVRQVMRVRHYSPRTEECYVQWITRFSRFHGMRHPRDMRALEVQQFLTHLAVAGRVSASTQNQALNALVFLYQQVLEMELGRFEAVRARRPKRLPVVLSPEEVQMVLERVQGAGGVFRLMARLLYGCGLRLQECCTLRVIYTHVARKGVSGITSPLDALADMGTEGIWAAIDGTLRLQAVSAG
jgi:site-specific recombinase XerD